MVSSVVTVGVLILALGASAIRADVAHLGYSRYSRPQTLRLQRLEGRPTPYPASGYRPNKEFHLPGEQPEFPLGSHPQKQENNNNNNNNFNNFDNNNNNGGFDFLSEPQQPELLYGAPNRLRPQQGRPQQPQQHNFNNNPQQGNFHNSPRQSNFNTNPQQQNFGNNPQPANFNNSPRQPNFNTNPQQATFSNNNNNPQQQFFTFAPEQTYGSPERQPQPQPQPEVEVEPQSEVETQDVINSGSNQLGEPQQRPNGLYAAPARLRQAPARLQQQQQRQQPQRLYATPQSGRLTAAQQSSRLTDNREEDEEDDEDTNTEIETEMKKEEEKKNASTAPAAAAGQNLATIAYYPAGAFSFVQPLGANFVATAPKAAYVTAPSAGYVSATGTYVTAAAPTSAIYQTPSFVAASPYVQQPLTFAAAPAQLNAW